MKVVTVIVFLALAAYSNQQETQPEDAARVEKIRQYRNECIEQTKVDPVLIDRADTGDFAKDPKLYCFSKCFYQKAGFVAENGDLLLDVIKEKIPKETDREKALGVIEKCKDLKGGDSCETVFLVHKCYFENTYKKD
ncbi:general odorant-binding protein 56d-like [Zophobas morio]|uniref:general odorant-binding protein 56d-like n=1 Tax=Zophobas morio TaxID=2755281 RepID=UPI003082D3B8